jgi:hypothetical protein
MSDSAISQRRSNLPTQVFDTIMEVALEPKAQLAKHPEAFYRGLRLVGIDGSQYSLSNTPQILRDLPKVPSRRMKAAFAKVGVCTLVELGIRNPLAAAIGQHGESELNLARQLYEKLPCKSLCLADRLYGNSQVIQTIQEIHGLGQRHFLLRVKRSLKPKLVEVLPDGSALVEVKLPDKTKLIVREIRGQVRRPKGKWSPLRLWTDLLDPQEYPLPELLELYGQRWEQEVFYRELKVQMRPTDVLQSHTVLTAAQEIAALILAHAILVEQRIQAAKVGNVEVLRISFAKTLAIVEPLWLFLSCAEGILNQKQIAQITRRAIKQIAEQAVAPRRQRSCPRAVRKPVSSWPRLIKNTYQIGPTEYKVTPVKR